MKKSIFKVYITYYDYEIRKYYFKGSKIELMTLIGCIYSTSIESIVCVHFEEITDFPSDLHEITYFVSCGGNRVVLHVC